MIARTRSMPFGLLALLIFPPSAGAQLTSPADELHLTLRRDRPGTIREVRNAQIAQGEVEIELLDVSPQILPETLHVRSLSFPDTIQVLEQRYVFEPLSRDRILELMIDQEISIVRHHQYGPERLTGRVVRPPTAAGPRGEHPVPLFLDTTDGKIHNLTSSDQVLDELVLDDIPRGIWNRGRLVCQIRSQQTERHRLELTYETRGLDYSPHYTIRMEAGGTVADVSGWARIVNHTGMTFPRTRIQLEDTTVNERAWARPDGDSRASSQVYPVAAAVTLRARQTLQVAMVSAASVPVRRVPCLFPESMAAGKPSADGSIPVIERIEFNNSTTSGLGLALPAGPVQVYLMDRAGRVLTHSGEVPPAVPGLPWFASAGPVPGVRALRHARRITADAATQGTRHTVRIFNERPEALEVEVLQDLGVRQEIENSSITPDRQRPGWALFSLSVASGSSAELVYDVVRH